MRESLPNPRGKWRIRSRRRRPGKQEEEEEEEEEEKEGKREREREREREEKRFENWPSPLPKPDTFGKQTYAEYKTLLLLETLFSSPLLPSLSFPPSQRLISHSGDFLSPSLSLSLSFFLLPLAPRGDFSIC
jgi:hypothetical protein